MAGYVATLTRVAQDYGVEDVYVPDFDRTVAEPVAATATDCDRALRIDDQELL